MPGKYLYEYAIIRIIPRVEREEFFNAGIILFSKDARYLKARYFLDENKFRLFSSDLDPETLRENLSLFDKICAGAKEGGDLAGLELPERFRWLTAVRSTSVQTSRPHTGYTDDPDKTLERLFNELVL